MLCPGSATCPDRPLITEPAVASGRSTFDFMRVEPEIVRSILPRIPERALGSPSDGRCP